jgi:hypothetical protein
MTDQKRIAKTVRPGDTVAFAKAFLQATGQYTGNAPLGRGTVKAVERLGETLLAEIDWGVDDLPGKVNVANLSLVKDGVVLDIG